MQYKSITIHEWPTGYQVVIPDREYSYFFSFDGENSQIIALLSAKKIIDEYFKLNVTRVRKKNFKPGGTPSRDRK